MLTKVIPFGHSTSQAPVLVQLPKPSASICSTIFITLSVASTLPWGKRANWLTLAETNNTALAFLQAATQAPQPIQIALLKDSSASSWFMGMVLASIVCPEVFTET